MAAIELALPDDVLAWIEETTGQAISQGRPDSRRRHPGRVVHRRGRAGRRDPQPVPPVQPGLRCPSAAPSIPLATEAAVMHGLAGTGVAVPQDPGRRTPEREAVLEERVLRSDLVLPDQGPRRAGPGGPGLHPQSGRPAPARSARAATSRPRSGPFGPGARPGRIAGIRWRGTAPDGSMDPLLRLSADWLERNVPDYDGPVVLVQGDTGPGNFLYQDGRVTAVVDWELVHWGDPMDDIAWLSLRTVQDTFTSCPTAWPSTAAVRSRHRRIAGSGTTGSSPSRP